MSDSASTDARVDEKEDNLLNTGGTKTSNQLWRVVINGKSTFVQTRLHKNGSISYVAIEKAGTTGTFGAVERPYILATVGKDGNTKFGGSGRIYSTGIAGIGGLSNVEVTTEETAKAILSTGTINGNASTQNQQLAIGGQKALALSKQRLAQQVKSGLIFNPDEFVPDVSVGQSSTFAEPIQVVPHNADGTPVVEQTEEQPGNNDGASGASDAAEPGATNIVQEFATEAGDKAKDFLQGIGDLFGNVAITPEEIAQFDKMFEKGGGDKIQNGMYPLDANYGNIRGQDYVTIDQFIYQPPRRDQIFGGTVNNLTRGSQRETPLKHFLAQVKLPMPNDIQDSNQISWGKDAMNNLSAALTSGVMQNPALVGGIGAALGSFNTGLGQMGALFAAGMAQSGGIDGAADAKNKAIAVAKQLSSAPGGSTLLKSNLGSMMLGAMGVNVSPESILARGFGVIPNSNTELLFNNIALRTFEFNWRMSPRDEKEADEVKKIIRFFKQGMAAKTMTSTAGKASLYLGSPNVFRLQYRTARGRIIEGVNRIKPVAVVGTSVNYTPDGQWSAYDKGQPVSCTLSVNMSELEPVYASDYSENDILSERLSRDVDDFMASDGDLYSIRPTEVGY